jgi:hypothetical protein
MHCHFPNSQSEPLKGCLSSTVSNFGLQGLGKVFDLLSKFKKCTIFSTTSRQDYWRLFFPTRILESQTSKFKDILLCIQKIIQQGDPKPEIYVMLTSEAPIVRRRLPQSLEIVERINILIFKNMYPSLNPKLEFYVLLSFDIMRMKLMLCSLPSPEESAVDYLGVQRSGSG